ncbi:hypothetical protein Ancab_018406 [Ancistrocladus abbreviatus]
MEAGAPHEALFLVLSYLPLYELLSTSQVCKSLRYAINNDVLPWLQLIAEKPLNFRLSDATLIKYTSRAKGRLTSLSLINCPKVTDDGLLWVVTSNPLISKLHVPGCTGLTPEGILKAVKMLTQESHCFSSLKINGIYNLKQHHLETLFSYLRQQNQKPHFRQNYINSSAPNQGNLLIDVEVCPICSEVKMVYDCPRETCLKRSSAQEARECRACYNCIKRCVECGVCFASEDEEQQGDAICQDALCLDCWLRLPKCNFCNKPYCRRHASDKKSPPAGSTRFVCDICHFHYMEDSDR